MARVVAALSGGVDSAVAAALLVAAGHEVTGVHLRLADAPAATRPGHGCCGLDDAQDARRTAQVLGIPFYVWDLSDVFRREVEDAFAAGSAAGVTPNPCITCNERVKYAEVLARARALGFDALATGHHARLRRDGRPVTAPGPGAVLVRARDRAKDQSYVLHVATPAQLAATLLPVGELTKDEVRSRAAALGLRVAAKPDSYDLCFVPDGDTAGWLEARLGTAPGPVVDLDGRHLGAHRGVWRTTVGQRRGLGLAGHERRFVVAVDAPTRTVVVGPREALACGWVEVGAPVWAVGAPPTVGARVHVQLRAHGAAHPATLVRPASPRRPWTTGAAAAVRLHLDAPAQGVALGQAAVLYDAADEVCLGGGPVTAAERPAGLPVVAA
jgi:tRNA-specific 2-thiouridylase